MISNNYLILFSLQLYWSVYVGKTKFVSAGQWEKTNDVKRL